MWNYYHCVTGEGMRFSMKLMGMSKLRDLATSGADVMSGAAAAMCAELTSATWNSPEDVMELYPFALVNGGSICVPMGERHCVDLIVNYHTGMVFIEYAGLAGKASQARRPRGRMAT